jgi:hypothetical protein
MPVSDGFTFLEFNRFFKRWRDRFERRWPGIPVVWVKELTKRGVGHLHFILVWPVGTEVPSLTEFRAWNDAAWAGAVKSANPAHIRSGCTVVPVLSWERLTRYLSGYLTKGEGWESESGRMWGVIGKKYLPVNWVKERLTAAERVKMSRALVRAGRSRVTFLVSKSTHDSSKRRGVPVKGWLRAERHPEVQEFVPPGTIQLDHGSFLCSRALAAVKADGWRIKRIRRRGYRREVLDRVWEQEEGSARVERSSRAPITVRRLNKVSGQPEVVQVDEVNAVAAAWHYLPSSETLRLLQWLRRGEPVSYTPANPRGLTACERRWMLPPG